MPQPSTRRPSPLLVLALLTAALLTACGGFEEEWEINSHRQPLSAYCSVSVIGKGTKQMETDYLANVINCENGAADLEALKAQAVAARTYAYYKIATSGSIKDGTGDQVYSCGKTPSAKHHQAVKETSGQVLRFQGKVICAFYVAGAKPSASSCVATSGDSDPTSTEKYVTYNAGKSGSGITQSKLGWVSASNVYNRGCMSQNGSHCQALNKKGYKEILKFYYGADIELITTTGSCVVPTTPPPPPPPPPVKYPVLTISSSARAINGQAKDLCQAGASKSIFDWFVGQKAELRVEVKNNGTTAAKNVELDLWAEEPYLEVARWSIYSDGGGSFAIAAADGAQTIARERPGKAFTLKLGSISPGVTRQVRLVVQAKTFSLGQLDHPDLRAWVGSIEGYYTKADFATKPSQNVSSYQTQNGGDLRTYVQTDVLDKETCGDGLDNDCDGSVDEGCGGNPDPNPGPDPSTDPNPNPDPTLPGGDLPPSHQDEQDELILAGGCAVAGHDSGPSLPTAAPLLALLLLALCARRCRRG
jgi:Stage II sporulation protein